MSSHSPFPPRDGPARPQRRRLLAAGALWPLAATAADAAPAEPAVPVYPTRLPGPAELSYDLSYGMLSGRGRLHWQPPVGGRYRLHMAGGALGLKLLSWASEGGVDAAGLAPLRFAEQRLTRPEQVVEFHREAGLIVFPAKPGAETRLLPGTQDKLSWLVQLPAILRAGPALQAPGTRITLYVTGARGDVDRWSFVVQGPVLLPLADGRSVQTLHLRRQPARPSDLQGEAWLDPALEHLPVRVRLAKGDGGDVLEFRLR